MAWTGTGTIIEATTGADTGTQAISGPTVIAITKALGRGESVTIFGEDAAGNFNDTIHVFSPGGKPSVLIETYRTVQASKTATKTAVAVTYGM